MNWGKWVIYRNPLLHMRFETDLPFKIFFSAKSGRQMVESLGLKPIAHLKQVHSAIIYRVDNELDAELEGDGLISNSPDLYLAVKVADCYPVFLLDPVNKAFGVVHAGWRGSYKGIVKLAVQKMGSEFGTKPENLFVVIGPGICGSCYEVSHDVAAKFDFGVVQKDGHIYLDLNAFNIHELNEIGVPRPNILDSPFCTYEREDLFWSYRRHGQRKRSMWAVIGLKTNKGR